FIHFPPRALEHSTVGSGKATNRRRRLLAGVPPTRGEPPFFRPLPSAPAPWARADRAHRSEAREGIHARTRPALRPSGLLRDTSQYPYPMESGRRPVAATSCPESRKGRTRAILPIATPCPASADWMACSYWVKRSTRPGFGRDAPAARSQ